MYLPASLFCARMNPNHMQKMRNIFFGVYVILVCAPFLYLNFFYNGLITTRVILWSLSILILIAVAALRARADRSFKNRIFSIAQHPFVLIFFVVAGVVVGSGYSNVVARGVVGLARSNRRCCVSARLVAAQRCMRRVEF